MSTTASPAPTSPRAPAPTAPRAPTTGTLPGYLGRYQPPPLSRYQPPPITGTRMPPQNTSNKNMFVQNILQQQAQRLQQQGLSPFQPSPISAPNESTTGQEFLSGRDMTLTQGPYSGAFEVPIGAQPQQPIIPVPVGGPIIPTPVGAQPQGKMGGGYPSAPVSGSPGPVSGDPGMAGGGMTPTTQPVGVAVPVDVEPFIAGQGEFMGGGSYGAPLRGSNIMPEDYANLYGGRFGRGR